MAPTTELELAQAAISLLGMLLAAAEVRAARIVWRAHQQTERSRTIAAHYWRVEVMRFVVHAVIFSVACFMLTVPPVPPDMPYLWAIRLRKVGYLVIAIIACAGTWSARRTRLRLWHNDGRHR